MTLSRVRASAFSMLLFGSQGAEISINDNNQWSERLISKAIVEVAIEIATQMQRNLTFFAHLQR